MKVTDPVCGVRIESEKAVAQEDYGGRTVFFCSDQCHRLFRTSPKRYAGRVQQSGVDTGFTTESDEGQP